MFTTFGLKTRVAVEVIKRTSKWIECELSFRRLSKYTGFSVGSLTTDCDKKTHLVLLTYHLNHPVQFRPGKTKMLP